MNENIKKSLIKTLSAIIAEKSFPDLLTIVINGSDVSVFYSDNDYYDGYYEVVSDVIKLSDLSSELKKDCDVLSKRKTALVRDVEQLEKSKNTIFKQLQKLAQSKE